MCRQAIACVLTVVGLTLLLLCFLPTWLTEQLSPPSPLGAGLGRAFWVGGLICVLGLLMLGTGIALLILWIKKGC